MSKTLYFVRHGQSEANLQKIIAGAQIDSPLTEFGRQQAVETANALNGISFDYIVSSPLSRAVDTAKIISHHLQMKNLDIHIMNEFIERDAGEFSGVDNSLYFAAEQADKPTGEPAEDMQSRLNEGLNKLIDEDFTNALITTHNGTIRVIETIVQDLPASQFAHLPMLANGEYLKVDLASLKLN